MTQRRTLQLELALDVTATGCGLPRAGEGAEVMPARDRTERQAVPQQGVNGPTMEQVVEHGNVRKALNRVRRNKGAPGVDGMTVEALAAHVRKHWPTIRDQLLGDTYKPQAVRRVEIPKLSGGTRQLGIPTVLDRLIQQAVLQVLQAEWDPTFSDASFGFRPNRGCHQAVARAQEHIAAGHGIVVDIDLEKFFDRVNHDVLMGLVAKRVDDKRILRLIRGFLTVGVLEGGLVSARIEGTPQGGPLSPLLSNLILDVLDKELERRGHRFVRYADDCNIYVSSQRAGERVMAGLERFLAKRLRLKVNRGKSAVAAPAKRTFLGFSLKGRKTPKRHIAVAVLDRLKGRVRALTRPTGGRSIPQVIEALRRLLNGWRGYFGFCETPAVLRKLDQWIRRRLRCLLWRQWRTGRNRYRELVRHGVPARKAAETAKSRYGPWRLSNHPVVKQALSNAFLARLGVPLLETRHAA